MSRLLVVTDRVQAGERGRGLVETVAATIDGGATTILLREKGLPRAYRMDLAEQLRQLLRPVGGRLIVAGPDPLGADAVHLAAADRTPLPGAVTLVGRSCHDAAELANLSGEDYATVSPIYLTASKPDYGPALGEHGLRELSPTARRPVYALGGVQTPEQAKRCLDAGGYGVAVMGAVMRAADPAATVAALLSALRDAGRDAAVGPAVR